MTPWLTGPPDDPAERAHRVVAAALRAAYAWTVRRQRHEAMREVARMTGVIMEAHGPGRGPTTPLDLIGCLRRPLELLPALQGIRTKRSGGRCSSTTVIDSAWTHTIWPASMRCR